MECHEVSSSVMRAGLRPGRSQGAASSFRPMVPDAPFPRVCAHNARPPAPARKERRDRPLRRGCHGMSCFVMFCPCGGLSSAGFRCLPFSSPRTAIPAGFTHLIPACIQHARGPGYCPLCALFRRPGPRAGTQPWSWRRLQRPSLFSTGCGCGESQGWAPARGPGRRNWGDTPRVSWNVMFCHVPSLRRPFLRRVSLPSRSPSRAGSGDPVSRVIACARAPGRGRAYRGGAVRAPDCPRMRGGRRTHVSRRFLRGFFRAGAKRKKRRRGHRFLLPSL